jgi:branched-chain amino acid transport system substrate-binding protein
MKFKARQRKLAATAVATGLFVSVFTGVSALNANAASTSSATCINKIFGPGGKAAGKGVTIKAGMLLAMTGAGSFFGNVMSKGAQLAAAQIKAAGGFNYKIEIADHKNGDVPTALTEVKRMVLQDKIEVLQTSYGAPSEAIAPIVAANHVLTLNGGGSSPGQLHKDFLWQNRMLFGEDPTAGALAWIHKKYPAAKSLAIIGTQENGVGAQTTTAPNAWKKLTGGTVVDTETHDVGATDFTSMASRVKASNADAIITYSFGNDPGYLVKNFRQANITAPIMGIEFTQPAQQVAGASYDTFNFATDFYNVKNPNPWNKCFVAAYRAKYHADPEYYGSNYYEQVFIYWELVKRVIAAGGNPLDGKQLQAALKKNPQFNSVYGGDAKKVGKANFVLSDHSISKPMGVFSVKNGEPVLEQSIVKVKASADPNTALVK